MKTKALRGRARDTYFEMVQKFPLVSIESDEQLHEAAQVVDGLLCQRLDHGGETYLRALSDLIVVYEDATCDFPDVPPYRMLAHLMEAHNASQADVARATGLPTSTVCAILSGKRKIALNHMPALAKYFHVPTSVFVDETGKTKR